MHDLDNPHCCGQKIKTPYCPTCGKKQFTPSDPLALLSYLKGQRNKTQAWVTRCQRRLGTLSQAEADRRITKHKATLSRWDAWITWVSETIDRLDSEKVEAIPL